MPPTTSGLHHVTAIAGDPERNADFYVGTLGLRLVKRTVNHDDPGTYHLYYGDHAGSPGTSITFFPWGADGREGRFGVGQTATTAYLIPPDSVAYWADRLASHGVDVDRGERFGETVLSFEDPDGIGLELVAGEAAADADVEPWPGGPVPTEHQLRGFHGVTLAVPEIAPTAAVLTEVLGFERDAEVGGRRRYRVPGGGARSAVDLVETDAGRGRAGVGTVHHVAFAAADVEELRRYREAYADRGLSPTEPIDRKYFTSVYCREPGGVLFEIATEGPGFTADEDLAALGSRLVLPDRLEDRREEIEAQLPDFDGPDVGGAAASHDANAAGDGGA